MLMEGQEVEDQDTAPDEFVNEREYPDISGDIDESINLMQPYIMRWNRCLEFTRGNQSYLSDQPSYAYGTARPRRGKSSVQINKLLPLYRNIAARLTTAYPSMAVMPASDSPEDLLKSRSSELALRYVWSAAKVKTMLAKAVEWLVATGNVLLHEYYDDKTGNVKLEPVRPHDVVFEPFVSSPEESEWIAIRCYATKAELFKLYPDHRTTIEEYSPTPIQRTSGPQSMPKNRLEYRHVYWTDGRRAIMVGSHYIWKGETAGDVFPVQLVRYTEVPGFLWGIGLIEPNLDLQILYNETRTQIIQNIKQMTNPKILCYEESLRDPGKAFTSDTGEKVWIKQGQPAPIPFNNVPMPAYALEEPQRLDLEMQDTTGIHSVSLGKRVSGVNSGKAINALSQNDMSQLQMTQEQIESAVTLAAQCLLVLIQHHYTEGKMVRMLDSTGVVVFNELKSTDITDTPEVFLEAGTLFRSEAQDREAKVYDMLELGLIDKEDAKRALAFRLMPLDLSEKMESLRHANQLLEAVVKFGAPIQVYPHDDTETLRSVFKRFMDTTAYYQLPPRRQDRVSEAYETILGQHPAPNANQQPQTPQPQPTTPDPLNEATQGLNEPVIKSNEQMMTQGDAAVRMGNTGSDLMPGMGGV